MEGKGKLANKKTLHFESSQIKKVFCYKAPNVHYPLYQDV